jgi:hypothetical protein
MSDMQAFRARLNQIAEEADPVLQGLARLTKATAAQLQALWTGPGWSEWAAEEPQPSSGCLP